MPGIFHVTMAFEFPKFEVYQSKSFFAVDTICSSHCRRRKVEGCICKVYVNEMLSCITLPIYQEKLVLAEEPFQKKLRKLQRSDYFCGAPEKH